MWSVRSIRFRKVEPRSQIARRRISAATQLLVDIMFRTVSVNGIGSADSGDAFPCDLVKKQPRSQDCYRGFIMSSRKF